MLAGCKLKSDALPPDASGGSSDAPVAEDASVDAPPDGTSDVGCSGVDADVVMYLTMNTPNVTIWPDLVGDHDGRSFTGTTGTLDPPLPGCGRAYEARNNIRLVIADSPDFDLAAGSVDLYALVPTAGVERGILSRDAVGQALPGHFEIRFSDTNQVVVRLQDAATTHYRCSAAQVAGEWVHIGVNWGAPDLELHVDGVLAAETTGTFNGTARTCSAAIFTGGIDGNDNPWVVTQSSFDSAEGSDTPVSNPLGTGVDELRLSRVRRTYD